MKLHGYREIWAVDFEFTAPNGSRPKPICMVAKEILSGRVMRLDEESLCRLDSAPFDTGSESLFIAYLASAEFGCFLELGWPLPVNVIDLYVEFRNLANGLPTPQGRGLLGALVWFNLPMGDAMEKTEMRELAIRGGPFSADEMMALTDYCQNDVEALVKLWPLMLPHLTPHALLRGRYMKAVAWMEKEGVPIDTDTMSRLQDRWGSLKECLVGEIDPVGEIWQGGSFGEDRFANWLRRRHITWPLSDSGRLKLDKDTFADMAKVHPVVHPIEQLRSSLSKLKLNDLAVGPDGRNRTMLSPFSSRSGRNQPSTSKFIFGNAAWLRSLIQPMPGQALGYVDWSQQEFGVGAVLSGDDAMLRAYESSDPYLAFAKKAGAVPHDATKASHPDERNTFKMVVLGVGYCMSSVGLASKLGISQAEADELLQIHRRCYPDFWKWSQGAADYAFLHGRIYTRFGWQLLVTPESKDRSLRNFPSQANGAEMMRLAAIYATEMGIRVCAPVHDAFLIEAPMENIDHEITRMRTCMARASADVLDGFSLDTDADIIRSPDRFGGGKGVKMWDTTMRFLN